MSVLITTHFADNVEETTAFVRGEITDIGGENADTRGFVYGVESQINPLAVLPSASGYSSYIEETGDYGVGNFWITISNLTPGATYYFRAFAHNSSGYVYGDEIDLKTKDLLAIAQSDYILPLLDTDTTAQLSPPVGKTILDNYQAGKISDDTNPVALTLAPNTYTEIEWSLTTSAILDSLSEIQFRVTNAGVPIDTYSVVPVINALTLVKRISSTFSWCLENSATIDSSWKIYKRLTLQSSWLLPAFMYKTLDTSWIVQADSVDSCIAIYLANRSVSTWLYNLILPVRETV